MELNCQAFWQYRNRRFTTTKKVYINKWLIYSNLVKLTYIFCFFWIKPISISYIAVTQNNNKNKTKNYRFQNVGK
jgi:hypothetical protein